MKQNFRTASVQSISIDAIPNLSNGIAKKVKNNLQNILKKILIGVFFVLGIGVSESNGQVVKFDVSGLTGGSGNYGVSPLTPTTSNSNTTIVGLTRGAGIGTTGTAAASAWGGTGFTTANNTQALGLSGDQIVTFSITPNAGYQVSLSDIPIYNIRRSSTGPSTGIWQYKVGAGSFSDIGSSITWGATTSSTGNDQSVITLSSISTLQNVSSTITFRLILWGSTGTSGSWYFNDQTSGTRDLIVNGTVSLLPATDYYVNDNDQSGDVFTTAVGNDANPGTAALPFLTITHAISVASAGNTIHVDAGTYNEQVLINKSLTIVGSNGGIHPAIGTHPSATVGARNAESIISHNGLYAFSPAADNIVIDGFKFTGTGVRIIDTYSDANSFHLTNCIFADNTTSSGTGRVQFGGGSHMNMLVDFNLFFDRCESTIYTGGVGPFDNFTVQYNKFQSEGNSIFWTASAALTGGVIDHNEFDGTIGGTPGTGYNNINIGQGGNLQITNNWFHNILYTAIQCGIIGGSVSGNKFESHYGLASVNGAAIQLWGGEYGTAVSTNVTIENNEIRYNENGVAPQFGIRLRGPNSPSDPKIDGTTIHVHNNSFLNGGSRADAFAILDQGDLTKSVDATCNWYATVATPLVYQAPTFTGSVTSTPWLTNGTDNVPATIGFQPIPGSCNGAGPVRLYTDNTLATLISSYSTIQAAVDAAAPSGNAIVADAGTYNEQVIVNKSLTILGPNEAISPNSGSRVAEAVLVNLSAGRAFSIYSGNTDVTIRGFKFDGGSPIHDGNDISNPNTSDVTFSKNLVVNANAIYAGTSTSWADLIITDNKFEDINATSTASAMQVSYTSTTTITDNSFTNVNYAAILIDATPTVNISGNTIDGTGAQGIQIAGAVGNVTVSNNKINDANRTLQAADRGAIRLYGSGFTGVVSISNNEITAGYNGITVKSGENITGKNITVSNNSITGLTAGKAIYHGGTGMLTATCNWYGVTGAGVAALVSGPVTYVPFLNNGTDNSLSIGFQPVPNSCTGCLGGSVTNTNTSETFCTIQAAIDAPNTMNGHTLQVGAGTYPEIITVNKELTILGPNVGVNPNTTGRVAEAIITYPTGLSGYAQMMTVIADNVSIDGFSFDGKDYLAVDGTSGIIGYGNNIDVKNNIVSNFNYISVWFSSYHPNYPTPGGNGFYRSDIDVMNNYIHNTDIFNLANGSVVGYGIYMQGALGSVTGNIVEDTKDAIQLQPYNHPNAANVTATVSNNTFEGYRQPMWFNYSENANARWSITNNNLVGIAAPTGSPEAEWVGLRIQNITALPNTLSFTGNTVNLGTANPTGRKYFFKKWGDVLVGSLNLDATYAANTWKPSAVITDGTNILNLASTDVFFYSKIQNALDDAASGRTVKASDGTFAESLTFAKSVTLLGANAAISPNTGGRGTESVIMPSTGAAITGTTNGVIATVKGFTFDLANSQGTNGHFMSQSSKTGTDWTYANNIFQNAGDPDNGNWIINGASTGLKFTLTDNLIQNNAASNGISIWDNPSFDIDVQNNVWKNNGAHALNLNGAQGIIKGNIFRETRTFTFGDPGYAWYNYQGGILLSDPGFNLNIVENEFYKVHSGVILYADVAGPINIENNLFDGSYDYSIRASNSEAGSHGASDLNAVVATNNSLINYNGVGKNISNARADNALLTTTCNWFGTANPILVQGQVSANVSFVPYLTNGTDNDLVTSGFQPVANSCNGNGPVRLYTDNTFTTLISSYFKIQDAVDAAAASGNAIVADAGTYAEDVLVNKEVEIKGAGATTIVVPATSNPNTGGGSLGGSNVFLIQANNVTIHDLTIDGDNPSLTSAENVGGANIDARTGIITNHTAGVYNNLVVHHVTVKNIFLRGMYASSGGSFNFHDNTVDNVQAEGGSIAMFNFGGSGSFTNNTVSNANDAIASNHSSGTVYSGNMVTNSGSGIHSDNNGSGGFGTADLIQNNQVSNSPANGYGIFVFGAYLPVTVSDNTITNVEVGLTSAGANADVSPVFTRNTVDGLMKPNSIGIYSTTEVWGYGSGIQKAIFTNNFIKNNIRGFMLGSEVGFTNSTTATNNSITSNTLGVKLVQDYTEVLPTGAFALSMNCNWWGTSSTSGVALAVGASNPPVTYSPWLTNGTDNDLVTPGFQPVPNSCNIVVIADPAIVDVIITDMSDVQLPDYNTIVLNSQNRIKLKIFNYNYSNAIPSGTTKIRIDLGGKLALNMIPTQLAIAPLSDKFTWTKVVESGHDVIYGDQIAAIPAGFGVLVNSGAEASFDVIAGPSGTSDVIADFQVTNHNGQGYFLEDETPINNHAESNYTVLEDLTLALDHAENVTCYGGNNGSITVVASGGATPYQYSLTGGTPWQASATFSGLTVGPYTVTVKDNIGQTATVSYTVTQPAVVSATVTGNNITCNGSSNGSIDLTVTGGSGNYTYLWSNGATTEDISGLAPGTYTVTITESNGCTVTGTTSITITEPTVLNATVIGINQILCYGSNSGSVTVNATGGTPTYEYSLDGGTYQLSGSFTGLTPGSHTVSAKDANGCTKSVTFTITEPQHTDVTLSSQFTTNLFPANGSEATVMYNVSEIGGRAATPATIYIIRPAGYTLSINTASGQTLLIGANTFTLDNEKWELNQVGATSTFALTRTGPGGNNTIDCNTFIPLRVAIKITRATPNKSKFNLIASFLPVASEIVTTNNTTSIIMTAQ